MKKELVDDLELLLKAAKVMDLFTQKYCNQTVCTNERMKSADNNDNCKWYHGGWMYCRLAEIVVSKDYLGEYYTKFYNDKAHKPRINILLCGLSDFAILEHVVRRIPEDMIDRTYITIVDICESPLELCKWYIKQYKSEYPKKLHIRYIKADATTLPFEDASFDMITSYSFLTRMVAPLMQKVVSEWYRLLKHQGKVLTTVRVNTEHENNQGDFYRGKNSSIAFAMEKVDSCIRENKLDERVAESLNVKVKKYLENIMSVSIPSGAYILDMFCDYVCELTPFDQPGELEQTHSMFLIDALKSEKKKS